MPNYSRQVTSDNGDVHTTTGFTQVWDALRDEFMERARYGGTYTQLTDHSFKYVTTGNTTVVYVRTN